MHATNYLENKLIDQIFRGRAYTFPTSLWLALFTVSPSDAGGGTEVSGGDYERFELPCDFSTFKSTQGTTADEDSSGTGGMTSNAIVIEYPTPSANWGTIVAIGIFDADTDGNMLFWGPLNASKTVNLGQLGPGFAEDALAVTCA